MSEDMKNSGRPLTGRMIVESLVTGAREEFAIINGVMQRRGKEIADWILTDPERKKAAPSTEVNDAASHWEGNKAGP